MEGSFCFPFFFWLNGEQVSVTLPEEPGSAFEKEYQIVLAARPDRLSSIPRPPRGRRRNESCKLSSDTAHLLNACD